MLTNYEILGVYADMMRDRPTLSCFLAQMTILPFWIKSYGLIILDAPLIPLSIATCFAQMFFGAMQAYIGAVASSIVDELQGNGQSKTLDWVIIGLGIVSSLLFVLVMRRFVNTHVKKRASEMEVARRISEMANADAVGKPDTEPAADAEPQVDADAPADATKQDDTADAAKSVSTWV